MSVRDLDEIIKEERSEEYEWDTNPIKKAIQDLFSKQLSESNYRGLEVDVAKEVVRERFSQIEGTKYLKKVNRILRSVDNKTSTTDIVLYLGENLID